MEANAVEMIIGSITKIICFLLPIIIPLKAFWLAKATIKPLESNITNQESLRINDSFAQDEEKNFWKSLKFNSKNTEKSSSDKLIKKTLKNNGRNSEIEEEKSPIDMISILSQTLQKISKEQKSKIYKNT